VPKRFYELQRLHVDASGSRNSISGIKCTLLGGSSPLGSITGGTLTKIGSRCIYPYRNTATVWNSRVKELKTTADLGYKAFMRLNDFTNESEIAHSIKDSNVVVSCIGSKAFYKNEKDFEDANINIPIATAKAVKNAKNVKRFIYVSAAGADPNSQSARLRTKWIGEQEVKAIYPDVTILRPTYMFNLIE
jgi:dTDP-4-dehydrorhamnose reductase